MSELDIDSIEARADLATPGPWAARDEDGEFSVYQINDLPRGITTYIAEEVRQGESEGELDAVFIAAARTDVPALCAGVRQLRAERDAATEKFALVEAYRDQVEPEVRQLRQALAAVREVLDAAEVYSAEAPYSDAMWQLRSEVLAALAAAVEGNPE